MSREHCLKVEHISKSFPTRGEPLLVLRDINFVLEEGAAVAVMGPSGSGKSTLLHILGTLDRPTSGTVLLDEQNPFELGDRELAQFRNRSIGFVFQEHYLLPQCSVWENVLMPSLVRPTGDDDFEKRAEDLLKRVGLSDRLEHRPAELSGGERQRAAIARALINKPRLLLCDEPTGNLDRRNAEEIGELFADICEEEGTSMVLVTHSLQLAQKFPRRMELVDGVLEPSTR